MELKGSVYHQKMAEALRVGIPPDPRVPLTDSQLLSLMLAVCHDAAASRLEKQDVK